MILLFEPWNLGDAIIAAAVARLAPDRITLACNSRWHKVLQLASNNSLNLLPLDLPYVWRTDKNHFSLGKAVTLKSISNDIQLRNTKVISIRGDLRDLVAACRIFKGSTLSFSGWLPFCARKSALVDLPFKYGFIKIRNRYQAWSEAAAIPFTAVEQTYAESASPNKADNSNAVIHIGTQWHSKQYPHVVELVELLRKTGKQVKILAGPDDPLPPGIAAQSVQRPDWPELVEELKNSSLVICNDSGPMHLAAFLGCHTIALSRCSNITEWLPPGVTALSSSFAPHGYRPIPDYWSDKVLTDWPTPAGIVSCLKP